VTKRAVTRKDVAKRAGVSDATVSYVFNGKNNVRPATRTRILEAAKALGYSPNLLARSLKMRESKQFAALVNSLGNPFDAGTILRLEAGAHKHGYFVSVHAWRPEFETELIAGLAGRVDGVVLLGQSLSEASLALLRSRHTPIVSINTPTLSGQSPVIDVDWAVMLRALIAHLKTAGHERIGFMTHSDPLHHYGPRFLAFQKALTLEGLKFDPAAVLFGEGHFENACEAMREALAHAVPYSALVCAGDLMAAGVIAACRERGVRIPEDLAVTGCEDILLSAHLNPPLTTMHHPRELAGDLAVDMLLKQLAGEPVVDHILESGPLFIRGTTRPLAL
jgi:DNA-binding LacI/PurR family transcriptional regulator